MQSSKKVKKEEADPLKLKRHEDVSPFLSLSVLFIYFCLSLISLSISCLLLYEDLDLAASLFEHLINWIDFV